MTKIRIYDTRTAALQELTPRSDKKVGIYACGPTVYGRIHVGNARPYVVYSLLKRYLEHEGYDVTFVANVTDINDKIYNAAKAAGVGSEQLAREMTQHYFADTDRLELGRPDSEPLATETISEIVDLIATLIERDHAYVVDGDVYFSVRTLDSYGELSHRDLEAMDQGEEREGADRKRDPIDFALWKAQKPDEDTAWDAPWGRGRPGWHIECSAMAEHTLGLDFEIHGGGADLIFPHHENELAQTVGARGKQLARIWMHNGMVELGESNSGQEKMSKSIGNIRLLNDALDEYGRDALILYFCSGRYRQPLAYSHERLQAAQSSVRRIRDGARRLVDGESPVELEPIRDRFFAALADDFNTADALAAVFDWIGAANKYEEGCGNSHLREMLTVFGLDNLLAGEEAAPAHVQQLAAQREQARAARDFARADALRDQVREHGWEIRDGAGGPELIEKQS